MVVNVYELWARDGKFTENRKFLFFPHPALLHNDERAKRRELETNQRWGGWRKEKIDFELTFVKWIIYILLNFLSFTRSSEFLSLRSSRKQSLATNSHGNLRRGQGNIIKQWTFCISLHYCVVTPSMRVKDGSANYRTFFMNSFLNQTSTSPLNFNISRARNF